MNGPVVHVAMGAMTVVLFTVGVFFILLELRTRYDRSHLDFGLMAIAFGVFCALDVWVEPQAWDFGRVKVQHFIAPFLAPALLSYILRLHGITRFRKVMRILYIGAIGFLLCAFSDLLILNRGGRAVVGGLYLFGFMPYVIGIVLACNVLVVRALKGVEPRDRGLATAHAIGVPLLSAGAVLDMSFMAFQMAPLPIDSYVVIGMLSFGVLVFFAFLGRFLALLNERDHTLENLSVAYREIEGAHALRDFAESSAYVHHEVKNYASAIRTMSRLALRKCSPDDRVTEFLQRMGDTAARLSGFSRDMLDLSRASTVRSRKVVGLLDVLDRCVDNNFSDHRDRVVITGKDVLIEGDSERLEQFFMNLLLNSFEAGSSVAQVSIVPLHNRAVVCVRDDGTGCTEESFAGLFRAFYSSKETRFGTGLGMSIVKGIVNSHGGSISAYCPRLLGLDEAGLRVEAVFPVANPLPGLDTEARSVYVKGKRLAEEKSLVTIHGALNLDTLHVDGGTELLGLSPVHTVVLSELSDGGDETGHITGAFTVVLERTTFGCRVVSENDTAVGDVYSESYLAGLLNRIG